MAARPTNCTDCRKAFAAGEAVYGAAKGALADFHVQAGEKDFLCEACATARCPKCPACGKAATGAICKINGQVYHADCLTCFSCKESIKGSCSSMGPGLACSPCAAKVHQLAAKGKQLSDRGDTAGAEECAKELAAMGIDVGGPPDSHATPAAPSGAVATASSSSAAAAALKCKVCHTCISGSYSQFGTSVLCAACGDEVRKDSDRAQKLAAEGDAKGAVQIAKKLAAKGLDVPTELLGGPQCTVCKETIFDEYACMGDATVCRDCATGVQAQMKELQAKVQAKDLEGAAAVARALHEKGIKVPPELLKAPEKCIACAKAITGRCMQMDQGYICESCGGALQEGAAKAAALLQQGDVDAAADVVEDLKSRGIPLPPGLDGLGDWKVTHTKQPPPKADSSAAPPKASAAEKPAVSSKAPVAEPKKAPVPEPRPPPTPSLGKQAASTSSTSSQAAAKADIVVKEKTVEKEVAAASAASKGTPLVDLPVGSGRTAVVALSPSRAAQAAEAASGACAPRPAESSSGAGQPGSICIQKAKLSHPIEFIVDGPVEDGTDAALARADTFAAEDRQVLAGVQAWKCRAFLQGEAEPWHVQVRGLPAPGGVSPKVALFLHGRGEDRCCAFWAHFWPALHRAGYHILAFDMPGHGRSGRGRVLPARDAQDAELVRAVIAAFTDCGPGHVSVLADGGGASAFVRAYMQQPELFSGHHVFTNPVIARIPDTLKNTMESQGADFFCLMADGWDRSDTPFSVGNCGQMFEFIGTAPDRVNFLTLVPPEKGQIVTPGLHAMREASYLFGKKVPVKSVGQAEAFFCLMPSGACKDEVVGYLEGPRKAPISLTGPGAPSKTALEMGEVNESFKVFVRIRPYLQREKAAGSSSCVQVEDVKDFPRNPPPQRIKIQGNNALQEFVFDRVFQPATQSDVFDGVAKPLVEAVLAGTNVTMFAYGQTGTGKTYTMEGPVGEEGLIHQAVQLLFSGLDATKQVAYQYVQLYNTDFKDLLDPDANRALAVEEGPKFMKVRGATIAPAASAGELLAAFKKGATYRASGKTNMNDASSRSHAILSIMIHTLGSAPEEGTVMYLVDLAGSERVKRSGVQAGTQGFAEATNINTSLLALGRVVIGLVERDGQRAGHIPYKDNELTYLLKSGIGGKSKTALICCITEADDSMDESMNTLRFALQASHVKNLVDAKALKDKAAADAEAIHGAGHELKLREDGTGECQLPTGGVIPVRGCWEGDSPVIVCLHDTGKDGSQFDDLIAECKGKARILAPTFTISSEKDPTPYTAQVLAFFDWVGIAKPVLVGRDYGAILCVSFKCAHPSRAGPLVLENQRQKMDAAGFKAKSKADPSYTLNQYMDCWTMLGDVSFGVNASKDKAAALNIKGLKGKPTVLWPCHFKGNHDRTMQSQFMFKAVCKELKAKMVDSYGFAPKDVAKEVLAALPKA
eukprot:TRINITY_DN73050_c0_g1_i1.p1 TRINITY_DN73050_c0_g1~~TRINITY_DN73050_c0_g1_i1.p1  ORF type:complete len:1438 (+),score=287.61 TRINITY_DN73050_c0_g1_i1:156-4469(+)